MQHDLFNKDGGKGGKLTGNVTEEMLDSSKSVLQPYMGRGTKGLQQFFSPPEAAELVHKVFGDTVVIDLTGGNGSLISKFPRDHRFGIEIDPDQAKANYTAIVGDIQKVYPLLRQVGFRADAIAINPPFGLRWSDAKYGEMNSTVLCYLYAVSLLSDYGQGMLIAGAERFDREILTRDEGKLFYAVERQDYTFRIDHLRATDARVKFLSLEPLLGPIPDLDLDGIDWVIAGGESGPGARPMLEEWVVDIRDRCQASGVPFFFKQWGGVNKKRNGRLLQGQTWDEYPDEIPY